MATRLEGSQHGEGIGGTVQEVRDPNRPSYDPAEKETTTDQKIRQILALPHKTITDWELSFLTSVYGEERLTKSQHIRVGKLHKKYCGEKS